VTEGDPEAAADERGLRDVDGDTLGGRDAAGEREIDADDDCDRETRGVLECDALRVCDAVTGGDRDEEAVTVGRGFVPMGLRVDETVNVGASFVAVGLPVSRRVVAGEADTSAVLDGDTETAATDAETPELSVVVIDARAVDISETLWRPLGEAPSEPAGEALETSVRVEVAVALCGALKDAVGATVGLAGPSCVVTGVSDEPADTDIDGEAKNVAIEDADARSEPLEEELSAGDGDVDVVAELVQYEAVDDTDPLRAAL
jgi:hypothetical protein